MCSLNRLLCRELKARIQHGLKLTIQYPANIRTISSGVDPSMENQKSGCSDSYTPFDHFIEIRRNEAQRSILVQVKAENSCKSLFNYCKSFGQIKSMHFYSINNSNFVLLEFNETESAKSIINKCVHLDLDQVVPVRSPLLWFRNDSKDNDNDNGSLEKEEIALTKQNIFPPTVEFIENGLKSAESFSDQMIRLYENTRLTDLDTRLRFVAAHQVESALKGMFPNCRVYPFGSSVTGFGKLGCDVDLALQMDVKNSSEQEQTRLIYHVKTAIGINRNQAQRHMEIIADILQYFLPGCGTVIRILNARVPILRYKQDLLNLDCDLSTTNMAAYYMSEMLYLYGNYDFRIHPLIFSIRFWAKELGFTNSAAGRWISNFSLTLLVIFYLQQKKIIPPLTVLVKERRPEDTRIIEDTDCSFLRDISIFKKNPIQNSLKNNDDSLFELFTDFFNYYSEFDFNTKAISLNTGTVLTKPEHSSMYIVNPLERHLNVSKNVSPEECLKLRIGFRNTVCILESLHSNVCKTEENWGLLHIVKSNLSTKQPKQKMKKVRRMMSVKELFEDDNLVENVYVNSNVENK